MRTGGADGAGRVSAANWGIGGGGLNIFFRGRSVHQETLVGAEIWEGDEHREVQLS